MKISLFLNFLFLLPFLIQCQSASTTKNVRFVLKGKVSDYFGPILILEGAEIEIIQNDKSIYKTKTTSTDYIIQHKFDVSKPFFIRYSYPAYFPKQILFDFNIDSLSQINDTAIFEPIQNIDIQLASYLPLFPKIGLQTVALFKMSNNKVILDINHAQKVKKEIEELKVKYSGAYEFLDNKGLKKAHLNFLDGELQGECIWYYRGGLIRYRMIYENGLPVND